MASQSNITQALSMRGRPREVNVPVKDGVANPTGTLIRTRPG